MNTRTTARIAAISALALGLADVISQGTGAGVQGQFSTVGFQANAFSLTGDGSGFLYLIMPIRLNV